MKRIKLILTILYILACNVIYSGVSYAGQVTVIPLISSCTTVAAQTTDTTSVQSIYGYSGYIGFSFTGVDANSADFTQTSAYIAYQIWDDNTGTYTQSYSNTTPTLYGSNGYPATSAWQITGNTYSLSNITAKKASIQAPVGKYITWSIINNGSTAITACTLNMVAQ